MASKLTDDSKHRFHVSQVASESRFMLPPIHGFEREPLVSLEKAVEPLISIVPQVKHMVWTVKQNYTSPKHGLSIDESASIRLFTLGWKTLQSSFHYLLNKTLRSEIREDLTPWFRYLHLFIVALSKLPNSSQRIFFCGTGADVSQDYLEQETFVWWDFISCTSSIQLLENTFDGTDSRTLFLLECRTAIDISEHSFYESEHEYLLYPARQFRVISSFDSSEQLKIIHLKETQPLSPLIVLPHLTDSEDFPFLSTNLSPNEKLQSAIDRCPLNSPIDLHRLNLTDNDIPRIIDQAITRRKCKELWLQSNQITAIGISTLTRALLKPNALEVLILHDNPLGDAGIQSLAKVLSSNQCRLTVLGLESTGITDEGAGYLAAMLKSNRSLISLGLGENNIANRGVQLLTNVLTENNMTLQEIYLVKNKRINDSSVDLFLQMLKVNRTLNRLWLDDCSLTLKGKDKLRQGLYARNRFSLSV